MATTLTIAAAAAAGLVMWGAWPSAARACSCLPPKPAVVAAREADAVFEGRPGRPVPVGNQVRYTFEVTRAFKGDVGPRVDIFTAMHSASCGRRFEPDTVYLVYARAGNDRLNDGLCSRTRTSLKATEDFAALGSGHPVGVPPEPARVDNDHPTTEPPRIEPVGPPPATPTSGSGRGCSAGEMPHGTRELSLAFVALLAVAGRRRQALR